jgi:hypothetical protein
MYMSLKYASSLTQSPTSRNVSYRNNQKQRVDSTQVFEGNGDHK